MREATMEHRVLGAQGPSLSTIGFGCWAMGGGVWAGSWGPQDDQESIDAIHTALDHGVNWFDTAAVYGLGHSEEVLGKALGSRRKDVVVATKCGLVWDDKGNVSNNGWYDSVMAEAEASLRRLGTDYIDLYQQHWPDSHSHAPVAETMRAMEDLVKAGKVRYVGVSNFDVPLLTQALAVRHVDSLQPPYNMLERAVEAEILPFCQEHGIGVVAYSPLASGLLGGRYTESTTFHADDWRSRDERFTGEGLRRNLALVGRLRAIAERHGKTVAQLALAWVLANPAVTSAIVGVRRPQHILDALPAADWHLDAATLAEIESVLATGRAGTP
ncbi:MAG: aldo/keto reductase [Chloroflexota bacterium]